MENIVLNQVLAKGIWCLIKEAVKALRKGVKKRPPSSSSSNLKTRPPKNKRRNSQSKKGHKFWIIKIIFEKN